MKKIALLCGLCLVCFSCTDYTPKPRGYIRIEPPTPQYTMLETIDLPYSFHVSDQAVVERPSMEDSIHWINISYPSLKARIYCSYFSVKPRMLPQALEEGRELVERSARGSHMITEQAYSDPSKQLYGSLFLLDGEIPSPIQFMLTDSQSNVFRGALYFDHKVNVDSLAPLATYLERDLVELIQSFNWKK